MSSQRIKFGWKSVEITVVAVSRCHYRQPTYSHQTPNTTHSWIIWLNQKTVGMHHWARGGEHGQSRKKINSYSSSCVNTTLRSLQHSGITWQLLRVVSNWLDNDYVICCVLLCRNLQTIGCSQPVLFFALPNRLKTLNISSRFQMDFL